MISDRPYCHAAPAILSVLYYNAIDGNFGLMNTMSIEEVRNTLKALDGKGDRLPASLTIVTCDLNRKTGGQRITYNNAVLINEGDGLFKIKGDGNSEIRTFNPLLITHCNGKEVSI